MPATTIATPITAQVASPLMKLPPSTPIPCSVKTAPTTATARPNQPKARRRTSVAATPSGPAHPQDSHQLPPEHEQIVALASDLAPAAYPLFAVRRIDA